MSKRHTNDNEPKGPSARHDGPHGDWVPLEPGYKGIWIDPDILELETRFGARPGDPASYEQARANREEWNRLAQQLNAERMEQLEERIRSAKDLRAYLQKQEAQHAEELEQAKCARVEGQNPGAVLAAKKQLWTADELRPHYERYTQLLESGLSPRAAARIVAMKLLTKYEPIRPMSWQGVLSLFRRYF